MRGCFCSAASNTAGTEFCCLCLQKNIDKIQSNLRELEAKLQHEQEKSVAYKEDLKTAEEM
jgi:outer membrane murein-binding lipoprotein Lpp